MRAVSREKRKLKGEWFDLYKVYENKDEADIEAKKLRAKKNLLVRVMRDYYWTNNTKYYLYTKPIDKGVSSVNFFDNLFEKYEKW
jgi:hypothetical protein|tara:strand:- start:865 stop:1119 length:255 start_codon:yes stop_codon:yes gene_type:complete